MIITNGQSAVEALRLAGVNEPILPWDDVLYDGPVPAVENHSDLSAIRAGHLASLGWGTLGNIQAQFEQRDHQLADLREDRLLLWFEHDLYDQLQLIQILHGCATGCWDAKPVEIICKPAYIAETDPAQLAQQYKHPEKLSDTQLMAGVEAWQAFTAEVPTPLEVLAESREYPLPFLPAAFYRLLQFYPDARSGLSMLEEGMVQDIMKGVSTPGALFLSAQQREKAKFMGDWSFFIRLDRLVRGGVVEGIKPYQAPFEVRGAIHPDFLDQTFRITEKGEGLLNGEVNFRSTYPDAEQWIGGVCLTKSNLWLREGNKLRHLDSF